MSAEKSKQAGLLKTLWGSIIKKRPLVNISVCVGCTACKAVCESKAIEMFACIPDYELLPRTGEARQKPEIKYSKCTSCYRCKEQCEHGAIRMRRSLFGLRRKSQTYDKK